ncbi:flagellar basal-body rod protein FlgF [Spirochaeta lutea]|uniref:Flagellar basal body rod protein FlgC n=1 Tax=Spirochaeta lutea TaxID=1480694 RepID=A0A098R2J5_9SPIO|nr:flagellar basal-body rod protein FlgF [Spirochaeta lutea]KGE73873.1 flagellar basal body rod protein FlgC [Spirochaeta lutea]
MLRGLYTSASGMMAQQWRLDAISNNLANVDTTGYKEDRSIHKAFPQLLLRRMNTNLTMIPPSQEYPILGSVDKAPVVGKLGTGVELNELFTIFEQGSLKETTNPFDVALEGEGFFVVQTPLGERLTRNGSFHLGPEGLLVTKEGYPVLGENGPISVKANNFMVDQQGRIFHNAEFADDPQRLVSMQENEWNQTEMVDSLRLVTVDRTRYLQKQGSSLYRFTPDSGDPRELVGDDRPQVRQGFLETSNVNAVKQMVQMIEVNRAYEANQKVIQSQDQAADKLINSAMQAAR